MSVTFAPAQEVAGWTELVSATRHEARAHFFADTARTGADGVVVDQSRTVKVPVTHGVDAYSETYDAVGGRQHGQVLDVDLGDRDVRAAVVEAGDQITDPSDETLTSMGNRTGTVAGINGDYSASRAFRPRHGHRDCGRRLGEHDRRRRQRVRAHRRPERRRRLESAEHDRAAVHGHPGEPLLAVA